MPNEQNHFPNSFRDRVNTLSKIIESNHNPHSNENNVRVNISDDDDENPTDLLLSDGHGKKFIVTRAHDPHST